MRTNHGASCRALGIFGKLSVSRLAMGALTWFEKVWSSGVEACDYPMKIK